MFVLLAAVYLLGLIIAIWVIPKLAKIAAEKTRRWIDSGQNPKLRYRLVMAVTTTTPLLFAAWVCQFSYGREVIVNSPFDMMEDQAYSALFVVSCVASLGLFVALIVHLFGAVMALKNPPLVSETAIDS